MARSEVCVCVVGSMALLQVRPRLLRLPCARGWLPRPPLPAPGPAVVPVLQHARVDDRPPRERGDGPLQGWEGTHERALGAALSLGWGSL